MKNKELELAIKNKNLRVFKREFEFNLGNHGFKYVAGRIYVRCINGYPIYAVCNDDNIKFEDNNKKFIYDYEELLDRFNKNIKEEALFFNDIIFNKFKNK